MLRQALLDNIPGIEQYVGLNTVNQIKAMPIDGRDNKMLMAIKMRKLIAGLKYEGILVDQVSKPLDTQAYRQCISTAMSFHNNSKIVVGAFAKIFSMLVSDLSLELPSKPKVNVLKELIAEGAENFDKFFEEHFTEGEKKILSAKKENNNLTGSSDLDWKSRKFSVILNDKSIYEIHDRSDFMKITNPNIKFILENTDIKEGLTAELQEMYNNIEVFEGRSRRSIYQALLTAALFRQPYSKYPTLVKKYKFLQEYKAKNTQ